MWELCFCSKCDYNETGDDNSTGIVTTKPHKGFNLFSFAPWIKQFNGCYWSLIMWISAASEEKHCLQTETVGCGCTWPPNSTRRQLILLYSPLFHFVILLIWGKIVFPFPSYLMPWIWHRHELSSTCFLKT